MQNQITDVTLVFFGMSVVMAFLAMIIIAISVAYYRLSKNSHKDREEFLKRQESARMSEDKILMDARKKVEDILSSAQMQAQELLKSSDIFTDQFKDEFRAKLLQTIAKEEQEFTNLYSSIKDQNSKVVSNISAQIEKEISTRLQGFEMTLKQELEKTISSYKNTAFTRIDSDVKEVVSLISKRVLRKSVSQDEQTDLVLQALDEAKKNNVL